MVSPLVDRDIERIDETSVRIIVAEETRAHNQMSSAITVASAGISLSKTIHMEQTLGRINKAGTRSRPLRTTPGQHTSWTYYHYPTHLPNVEMDQTQG